MRHLSGTCVAVLLLAFLLAVPVAARANTFTTTLDTLLPGGSNDGGLTGTGLRFFGFTFESVGPLDVSPQEIRVQFSAPAVIPAPDSAPVSILFSFITIAPADATPTEITIGYWVDGVAPAAVNRTGSRFNRSIALPGAGDPIVAVTQSLAARDGSDLSPGAPERSTEVLSIFSDGGGPGIDVLSSFLDVNAINRLDVRKELLVTPPASGVRGEIGVSTSDLYYTVPEPSAAVLLSAVAAALLGRNRPAGRLFRLPLPRPHNLNRASVADLA